MSRRIEKVNRQIQRVVGEILQTEVDLPNDALVTIAAVDTQANLQAATVWLTVYPVDRTAAVLAAIDRQMYNLQGDFNRAIALKPLPRLQIKTHENG